MTYVDSGAEIDPSGLYRYRLWRQWGTDPASTVLFVMLNPSTADGLQDDPTIRRCVGFAKSWGFHRLAVVNLFAYRATDPNALRHAAEPTGDPLNINRIALEAAKAKMVVCAWGSFSNSALKAVKAYERGRLIEATLKFMRLYCLGTNKDDQPKHPLYVPSSVQTVAYMECGVRP